MNDSNDFAVSFAATLNDRAVTREIKSINAAERFAQSLDVLDKREAQREATHAKYDAKLASLSVAALAVAESLNIEASAIESQSRELKKRVYLALEAIAANARVADRAFDAVLQYLVTRDDSTLSYAAIKRETRHETFTQASYMKNLFKFFSAVKSIDNSSANVSFVVDTDSAFVQRLMSIYKS